MNAADDRSVELDVSASKTFFSRTVLLLKKVFKAKMSSSIDLSSATFNHLTEAHFVIIPAYT